MVGTKDTDFCPLSWTSFDLINANIYKGSTNVRWDAIVDGTHELNAAVGAKFLALNTSYASAYKTLPTKGANNCYVAPAPVVATTTTVEATGANYLKVSSFLVAVGLTLY